MGRMEVMGRCVAAEQRRKRAGGLTVEGFVGKEEDSEVDRSVAVFVFVQKSIYMK